MNKKTYTVLFTIVSTIINILCTLIVIAAFMALATLLLNKVIKCTNGQVYMVVYMFCFLGGMVLNIFLFSKASAFFIKKFNLSDKLDPRLMGRTLPGGKKNDAYKEDDNKFKSKMPDSVLEKEDDWGRD